MEIKLEKSCEKLFGKLPKVIDFKRGGTILFSDIKVWNRTNEKITKHERIYNKFPFEYK
jgi:hypothetical protein